jgi:hypothetical protein
MFGPPRVVEPLQLPLQLPPTVVYILQVAATGHCATLHHTKQSPDVTYALKRAFEIERDYNLFKLRKKLEIIKLSIIICIRVSQHRCSPVRRLLFSRQYQFAVICAQHTRRAAPRSKGRSVRRIILHGLREDACALCHSFQVAANCTAAKQLPRCHRPTAYASSGL